MEIAIKVTPKEIADLIVLLQGQQKSIKVSVVSGSSVISLINV